MCLLVYFRPDMTFAVDWALSNNYLSILYIYFGSRTYRLFCLSNLVGGSFSLCMQVPVINMEVCSCACSWRGEACAWCLWLALFMLTRLWLTAWHVHVPVVYRQACSCVCCWQGGICVHVPVGGTEECSLCLTWEMCSCACGWLGRGGVLIVGSVCIWNEIFNLFCDWGCSIVY